VRAALIAWALVAAFAATAKDPNRPTVTGVTAARAEGLMEVHVRGRDLGTPKMVRMMSGHSVMLTFAAQLEGRGRRFAVNRGGLTFVRFGWGTARPPTVRVHLRVTPQSDPELVQVADGWIARIHPSRRSAQPAPLKPVNPDQAAMALAMDRLGWRPNAPKAEAPRNPVAHLVPIPKPVVAAVAPNAPVQTADFPKRVPPIEPVREPSGRRLVSITTDRLDILRLYEGLAMQAQVNIVVAPDVSPADKPLLVTMRLNRVPLEEALAITSGMTGTKYARVGNTYVVTLTKNFADAMRQIVARDGANAVTRVVALKSGDAGQIRDATLKAIPQEGKGGWYEIIVQGGAEAGADLAPGDAEASAPPSTGTPALQPIPGMPPAASAASAARSGPPAAAQRARSFYLMLVGDATRLIEVERYVREIDDKIVQTFALRKEGEVGTAVVPIFSGQPERIKGMLERMLSGNPRANEFSISHTMVRDLPEGEESTTVMLVLGPDAELKTLENFTRAIDDEMCAAAGILVSRDPKQRERIYEVVGLKYIEPTLAEFDLKSRVRGLFVTVMPDVVKPGLTGEAEADRQAAPQDQPAPGQPGQGGGARETEQTEIKRTIGREPMKLMLRGTRDQIERAKEYLAKVDVPPKQVALELRVMDLSREDAIRAGIDWNLLTGGAVKLLRLNNSQSNASNFAGVKIDGKDISGDVSGTLDRIANRNNLIARPNVLAMDGRSTELFVGDVVRYVESIVSGQNGPTVSTKELPVGVRLAVTPRIGSGGAITMNLRPTVSFIRGFTTVEVPGTQIQLPQTSERTATSELTIENGETIAIGGLIQDQDRRDVSGVPILMDIPIIGQLFRRTNNTRVRSEIVIFLTARVVDGAANAGNVPLPPPADKNGKEVKR
jgi:type II secretory pathway component GspD/PulD (secretin)